MLQNMRDEFRDSNVIESFKTKVVDALSFKKREPKSKLTELIGKPIAELKLKQLKQRAKIRQTPINFRNVVNMANLHQFHTADNTRIQTLSLPT